MKQIVYILPYLEKGGTETHVLELIKGLCNKGYNITLLAPNGPRLKEFQKFNINYMSFTGLNKSLIAGIRSFKKVINNIKPQNPDLIHIHAAHELLLLTKLFLKDVTLIFTVHGYHGPLSSFDYRVSSIFNNWFSDEIITVSEDEKNLMRIAGSKEYKLNLIYNGVSVPDNISTRRLPSNIQNIARSDKKIIGTVARLEKAKGIEHLLYTYKEINNCNCHLLIIGSGSLEDKLKEKAKELNLTDITFTGYVNNVHDYLEIMDLFVLPSLKEPFGLVCAEAMAHSLPVVASATGGIKEVVQDNKTGFLVDPTNYTMMAAKILTLLNHESMAKEMGQAGFKRYKQLFTTNTMINKTEQLYQKYI